MSKPNIEGLPSTVTIISQSIHSIDTTDVNRVEGGTASRCSGGRDEPPRPLTCSIQSVTSSISGRRWVPPSSVRRDANTPEERQNGIFRRVRGILNKITPEKFRKLSQELLSVGLDSPAILKGVILLIFDKALEEPKYSSMYAQLCRIISEKAPNFEHSLNNNNNSSVPFTNTFCRLLLAKCQDEFENRRKASEAFDAKDAPLTAFEEEQRSVAKHKMLGNIKFICELGKQNLLQESILHLCIKQLLSKKKRDDSLQDKAEDLECLCQIMKTVGRLLDTEKAKALMEQYFERMEHYAYSNELPCRIRFMLQDVLELRRNTDREVSLEKMENRIKRELTMIFRDNDLGKNYYCIEKVNDSFNELFGRIRGPSDTPYQNGVFKIEMKIPHNYPFVAPNCRFVTKVWHPNISSVTGAICLDILKNEWTPGLGLEKILLSIQSLMASPEPNNPQDGIVAKQCIENTQLFERTAKYWTMIYANDKDFNDQMMCDPKNMNDAVKEKSESSYGLKNFKESNQSKGKSGNGNDLRKYNLRNKANAEETVSEFFDFDSLIQRLMKEYKISRDESVALLSCHNWDYENSIRYFS